MSTNIDEYRDKYNDLNIKIINTEHDINILGRDNTQLVKELENLKKDLLELEKQLKKVEEDVSVNNTYWKIALGIITMIVIPLIFMALKPFTV